MIHGLMRCAAAAAIVAGLAGMSAPRTLAAPGGTHTHIAARPGASAPLFALGVEGGNILPYSVTIGANGVVTVTGRSTAGQRPRLSPNALAGLLKLARAEGFFTMPAQIVGHGLPDVAGTYISIHSPGATRTVHERFAHNAGYDQLYAVLMAVAGVAM